MHEWIPVLLGAIAAGIAIYAPLPKPRSLWFVLGAVCAGALGAEINRDFVSPVSALFLSLDSLSAWLGAIGYATAAWAARKFTWPYD
jgi:hypothetical protein